MNPSYIVAVLGVAAAMTGGPSNAGDRIEEARRNRQVDSGMQDLTNAASHGQPGYGWRYFADAGQDRTAAISPSGDYFYSDGPGYDPVLVFKAAGTP